MLLANVVILLLLLVSAHAIPEDVDFFACYQALFLADSNNDGTVNRTEFYDFVVDFGRTECLEGLEELDLRLNAAFNVLACLCEERGRGTDCCLGENAHIETAGSAAGDRPDLETVRYLTSVCIVTDRAIQSECNIFIRESEPFPALSSRSVPLEEEDSTSQVVALVFGIVAATLLCCLLCVVCCYRRRKRTKMVVSQEMKPSLSSTEGDDLERGDSDDEDQELVRLRPVPVSDKRSYDDLDPEVIRLRKVPESDKKEYPEPSFSFNLRRTEHPDWGDDDLDPEVIRLRKVQDMGKKDFSEPGLAFKLRPTEHPEWDDDDLDPEIVRLRKVSGSGKKVYPEPTLAFKLRRTEPPDKGNADVDPEVVRLRKVPGSGGKEYEEPRIESRRRRGHTSDWDDTDFDPEIVRLRRTPDADDRYFPEPTIPFKLRKAQSPELDNADLNPEIIRLRRVPDSKKKSSRGPFFEVIRLRESPDSEGGGSEGDPDVVVLRRVPEAKSRGSPESSARRSNIKRAPDSDGKVFDPDPELIRLRPIPEPDPEASSTSFEGDNFERYEHAIGLDEGDDTYRPPGRIVPCRDPPPRRTLPFVVEYVGRDGSPSASPPPLAQTSQKPRDQTSMHKSNSEPKRAERRAAGRGAPTQRELEKIRLRPSAMEEDRRRREELELRHIENGTAPRRNEEDWKPPHYEPDGGVHFPERDPWEGGYEADGGVDLPGRPSKRGTEQYRRQYERAQKEEAAFDNRRRRMIKGLGDGEVWRDLARPAPRWFKGGLSDALDWVIRSALNSLGAAQEHFETP